MWVMLVLVTIPLPLPLVLLVRLLVRLIVLVLNPNRKHACRRACKYVFRLWQVGVAYGDDRDRHDDSRTSHAAHWLHDAAPGGENVPSGQAAHVGDPFPAA